MYPRIRALREDRDLSQRQVAQMLGMSQTGYSKYETGENDIPTQVLIKLARFYDTSVDYLLGLTDIDPSDEARKQRQRLTEEEQNEMHRYEEYLLWKRKK